MTLLTIATTQMPCTWDLPHNLDQAEQLVREAAAKGARPYIRKFQSQPVTDLVNGNLCLSLGYSGDMTQAQRTADSAGKNTTFQYRIPREGTTVWMDTMAIPVDAKHPDYAYAMPRYVRASIRQCATTRTFTSMRPLTHD